MGRKKKTEIQATESPTVALPNAIKYQGNVKVSIVRGKKILSSKKFKNTGYIQLFKFICECLAGNYDSGTRPCRIALYTKTADTDTPSNPDLSKARMITSAALIANSTSVVKKITSGSEEYYTTTYHFLVPFAYITAGAATTIGIYKAALLKDKANLDYDTAANELCASFCFTKEDNKTQWEPIEIEKAKTGNFSIIIEWEVSIKN